MSLLLTSRRLLHSAAQRMVAASTAAHSGTGDLLSIFTSTEESQGLNTSQYTSAPAQTKAKCALASSNPCEHTLQDANAFFVVNPKDEPLVSNVFLKRRRCEEIKQQGFCSFLLRQQALQAAQLLDASEDKAHMPGVFFTGQDGHGKSMALAYLGYRYWKKGWVVLPIASGARWVLDPQYIDASTSRKNRIDSTRDAIHWLNSFYKLNDDRVAQLATSKEYTWLEGSHTTPAGTPLKRTKRTCPCYRRSCCR